jgi:hypothetical protein
MEAGANRTYLAGLGVSAALVAAALTAFVLLGAYVAFNGWSGEDSRNRSDSVAVGRATVPNTGSARAAKAAGNALAGAPAAVVGAPISPSATQVAFATGVVLPPGFGGPGGSPRGGGGGGGGGGNQTPGFIGPPISGVGGTIGQVDPAVGPLGSTIGGLGTSVDRLLFGDPESPSLLGPILGPALQPLTPTVHGAVSTVTGTVNGLLGQRPR